MGDVLAEARRRVQETTSPYAKFKAKYFDRPSRFVRDCIKFDPGERPTQHQLEIVRDLPLKKREAIRGGRGFGKCLHPDDDVLLADGTWRKAGSLVGKEFNLICVDDELRPCLGQATGFDNGVQPIIEIETKYGYKLRRTPNHPVWADIAPRKWASGSKAMNMYPRGRWTEVKDLAPGAVIAVQCLSGVFGTEPVSNAQIVVTACLLGDGSLTGHCRFSQVDNQALLLEFQESCDLLGCEIVPEDGVTYRVRAIDRIAEKRNGRNVNPIIDLLRCDGLYDKNSHDKFFPDWVWKLPARQLAFFLSCLYGCDGWAYSGWSDVNNKGLREIGYCSVSERLARDVQRALLRLGIVSRFRSKKTVCKYDGKTIRGTAYTVDINRTDSIVKFCDTIGMFGKEDAVREIRLAAVSTDPNPRQKLQKRNLPAGFSWDKVRSARYIGECQTVGISVEPYPTFLTEFVEHNTALASWLVLWFALTRDGLDWKVVTTASVWRQVEKFLWPEIHKWARAIDWNRVGRPPFNHNELFKMSLELSTGQAFGVASTDPNYVEGAHARHLLYILDEAKSIPDRIWDASEGAFASPDTAEAFALAISTPGEPIGRFYDIHTHKPGLEEWYTRHITIEESIRAGRVSEKWVEAKRTLWGENSSLFQNQVLGNFATADEDGIIPLHWIEAAQDRYLERVRSGIIPNEDEVGIGIDIGRTKDQSVVVVRKGNVITDIYRLPMTDTMTTTGNIINYLRMHGLSAVEPVVDVIGIGAGVVDRLREQGVSVLAYHASESTDFKDTSGELEFLNKRAAGWWKLREELDPSGDAKLAIPPDDILTRELSAPRWTSTSAGKIKIESKDDIRKRIGRSTDTADALIMALYGSSIESTYSGGTVGVVTMRRIGLV